MGSLRSVVCCVSAESSTENHTNFFLIKFYKQKKIAEAIRVKYHTSRKSQGSQKVENRTIFNVRI